MSNKKVIYVCWQVGSRGSYVQLFFQFIRWIIPPCQPKLPADSLRLQYEVVQTIYIGNKAQYVVQTVIQYELFTSAKGKLLKPREKEIIDYQEINVRSYMKKLGKLTVSVLLFYCSCTGLNAQVNVEDIKSFSKASNVMLRICSASRAQYCLPSNKGSY